MIPKSLTIKGLYSYQTEQTIDFTQLAEANVFGIFGKVGAGKSSILEAILYALYGEVERLDSRGRSYNMMNLSVSDFYIVFDFEIAGKLYRSKATGRRNSRQRDDVKIDKPQFFELVNGNFTPLSIATAEPLLRLNVSDFTKTIIIPQNTFQAFLQLKDTERARMMKELFGLERFDLANKNKVLQERNTTETQILDNQITALGDISPQILKEKETQLIDNQQVLKDCQTRLDNQKQASLVLEKLKTDFVQLNLLRGELAALSGQEAAILAIEQRANRFESAVHNFKNLVDNRRQLHQNLTKTQTELSEKRAKLAKNALDTEGVLSAIQTLKPQFENREGLKKQAADMRLLAQIRQLENEVLEKTEKIELGQKLFFEKKQILQDLKNQATEQQNNRQQQVAALPDWRELNALKDWFSIDYANEKEIGRLSEEWTQVRQKLSSIDNQKILFVKTQLPSFGIRLPDSVKISEAIGTLKTKITTRQTETETAQHNLVHLKATAQLETLANNLQDDVPCPLCGATHHPSPLSMSDVKADIQRLENLVLQLRKESKTLENIENEFQTLLINFNNDAELSRKLESQRKAADQQQRLHRSQFSWENFDRTNPFAVEQAIENGTLLQQNIEKIDLFLTQNNNQQEKILKELDLYQTRLNERERERTAANASAQTLQKQVTHLVATDFNNLSAAQLNDQAQQLDNQLLILEKQFLELEKNAQNLAENAAILRGGIEALLGQEKQILTQTNALSIELETNLKVSDFSNLAEIEAVLNESWDLTQTKKDIATFKNQQLAVQIRERDAASALSGKTYDADQHQALNADNQTLTIQNEHLNETIGNLKSQITDLKIKLDQRKTWQARLRILHERAENLKILRGLFTSSGFVNFASSRFLESICAAANTRFRQLTRGQLELSITDSNNFQIRDLANRGQTRDVKTLSGGQTFQAALSLALALSDHIQSREQTAQRFFFMDEGFGSLDRDSLQIVFETLKSLRKEQRIVGIISHLEDLQQEIDRYIWVECDEKTGSRIVKDW